MLTRQELINLNSTNLYTHNEVSEPPWGQQTLFEPQNSIPMARTIKILTTPNGAQTSLLAIDGSDSRFIPIGQIGTAIGYANYDITGVRGVNADTIPLCYHVKTRTATRPVMGKCIDVKDIPSALKQYIEYTYGARQGSMKYRRHMEASRLAVWWKNVVLEK